MTRKVLITRIIPPIGIEVLGRRYELILNEHDRPMTKDEIKARVADVDGILCLLTDRIDDTIIAAAPGLIGIANYAVGFDNIDVAAATRRGIPVTNTPGVLTEATAELAIALMFAVARRIPEADRFTRSGVWNGWGPMQFLGADITGATLGIVGMGKIGRAVGRRGHALGMTVVCYEEAALDAAAAGFPARRVGLSELLSVSDFVSLHVPLTERTHRLIGSRELGTMKPTAYLINTSRGQVVDEAALADALARGVIAGAGLDVYEREPAVDPRLPGLENCVLLPHIGSATTTTRSRMARTAAECLVAMIEGTEIPNLVNPDYVKYRVRE
jgi:glyoxylate reductase